MFPGSSNLPLLAAINKGFFAKRGLTIEVQNTPDSDSQRAGLPAGRFDIAIAGGGLAGGLIALALHRARPELAVVLIESGAEPGGNHRWSWDLRSAQGQRVPTGTYIIRFSTGSGLSSASRVIVR